MQTEPTRNPHNSRTPEEQYKLITIMLEYHLEHYREEYKRVAEHLRLMRIGLFFMAFAQGLMLALIGKALFL